MTGRAGGAALIVPDEETWLASGAAGDRRPPRATLDPASAELLLLPERVPAPLVDAVRMAWARMPPGREMRTYRLGLPGLDAAAAIEGGGDGDGHEEHGDHGHDGDDGHHDHEEMMAITGEPSADGLVMEDLEVELGPLGGGLPGGLVVVAALDGDVVTRCHVRQSLGHEGDGPPDGRAGVAWTVAELRAAEAPAGAAPHPPGRLFRIAAVELERALSHVAWLHGLCRLLGWARVGERTRGALLAIGAARRALPVELATPDLPDPPAPPAALADAHDRCSALARDLAVSRALAHRTGGLAQVGRDEVEARLLTGPVARACGVAHDLRAEDPDYAALGFEPTLEVDGDARARTLVRVREAVQSLALASAALEAAVAGGGNADAPAAGRAEGAVEGPRGPLLVRLMADGRAERSAPGARSARELAGELARGCEWSAGLVTIVSFDLSPWRVGP